LAFNFLKTLDADDIFISYSREDGSAYLTGLDAALSARGFSCFTDRRGTDAGRLPPETLFRRIRLCKTFVLLGTPGAVASPENITPELKEFADANGTSRIICVSFDGGKEFDDFPEAWNDFVVGKAREREAPEALKTGTPSESVVAAVAAASDYMKSKDRLRKYRNRAIGVLGVLVVASVAVAIVAGLMFKRAVREQAIGDARSLANRAQTILRQNPQNLPGGLKEAVAAMNKSVSAGFHSVEADTALRESLAFFPRLQRNYAYGAGLDEVESTALSPDGRYLASVSKDGKLLVYKSGSQTPLNDALDCRCSQVALSSAPVYAAALTGDGVVKIFNLEDRREREGRPLRLPPGVSPSSIALSPGGRYLALASYYDYGKEGYSRLSLLEAATGKVVKTFEDSAGRAEGAASAPCGGLDMLIGTVAFGPGGDLAVGGHLRRGPSAGQVVIWPLGLAQPGAESERELTDASFDGREVVPLGDAVGKVALGWDSTLFATKAGVWKKASGRPTYEPVARLPEAVVGHGFESLLSAFRSGQEIYEYSGSSVMEIAFGPERGSLSVVRNASTKSAMELEVWDAAGHWDSARALLKNAVGRIGFVPGGDFVVTLPQDPSPQGSFSVFRTDGAAEAGDLPFKPGAEDGKVIYLSPYTGHLVTANGEAAAVWDVSKKKRTVSFRAALHAVEAAALSPDGGFLALAGPGPGGEARTLVVYRSDGETFSEWKRLPPELFNVSLDGIGGRPSRTEPGEPDESAMPLELSLSSGGRVVAAWYLLSIGVSAARVFDVGTGRDLMPERFKFSVDKFNSVREDDGADGNETLRSLLRVAEAWTTTLMSLSPDGRFLAMVSLERPLLLNLSTGQTHELLGEGDYAALAFSPDGRHLGVGSEGGILHVFETASPGDEIARLQHTGEVTAVAFSHDGRYVATASRDWHVENLYKEDSYPLRIWLLRPEDLLAEADARTRGLLSKLPPPQPQARPDAQ
jgi:WD40 repeat protein